VEKRTIVIEESKLQEARAQPSRLTMGLSQDQLQLDKAYPVSGQKTEAADKQEARE
jgi:hypothetical protein